MNRARRELIEELLSVGRLIDRTSRIGEYELDDSKIAIDTSASPVIEEPTIEANLDNSPTPEEITARPYDNIDMFSTLKDTRSTNSGDHTNLEIMLAPASHEIQESSVEPEVTDILGLETLIRKEASCDPVPTEELARELVDLIGNRINQRTGEQLDDAMCDDLMQAVIKHIDSWLEHD